jgi:hypothetical protein
MGLAERGKPVEIKCVSVQLNKCFAHRAAAREDAVTAPYQAARPLPRATDYHTAIKRKARGWPQTGRERDTADSACCGYIEGKYHWYKYGGDALPPSTRPLSAISDHLQKKFAVQSFAACFLQLSIQ